MKILVAENDLAESAALLTELKKAGHTTRIAERGDQAWEMLTDPNHSFDMVIAARELPYLNGVSLCRRVRETQAGGAPYFLLFSENGDDAARQLGIEAGADDFLLKPLNPTELTTRLEVARRILGALSPLSPVGLLDDAGTEEEAVGLPIGEILVAYDIITAEVLREALTLQKATGAELGAVLLGHGLATEEDITLARSVQLDMPYMDGADLVPERYLLERIPEEVAREHGFMPVDTVNTELRGRVVRVAVGETGVSGALDLAQRLLQRPVELYLCTESVLAGSIERAYRVMASQKQDLLMAESLEETLLSGGVEVSHEDDEISGDGTGIFTEEAPVIRFINSLFADATRRRASDIHIEAYKRDFEIRYRIDGELHVMQTLPKGSLAALTSRIKIMADLDITERRTPQDGRLSVKVDGVGYDMRVSTLPTQYGERVVMRVLDRSAANRTLDELGFSPLNRDRFTNLIHRPHGIILVTGPTGSGKTTTLYATLNALKSPSINIMTCEDPIEYELDRIGQSNVNVRAGLTFAAQLRAILRQDPDVVLVGEIRDAETAETAFRAALTGHLVLSTLHCNEAVGAPTRLLDMGVAPFLIASALIGSVAQRLVRRLCPHCKVPYTPSAAKLALLEEFAGANLHGDVLYEAAPGGCVRCNGVGTRGRMGVHEVALIDEKLQSQIMRQAETSILRETAIAEGMAPMVVDGIDKVRQGLTTLDDIQRKIGTLGVSLD